MKSRKHILFVYLVVSIFPGILCSGAIQPFFFPSEGGHLLLGLFAAPLPFVLLATILFYNTRTPSIPVEDRESAHYFAQFLGAFAIVGFLLAVVSVIVHTNTLSDVMRRQQQTDEYALPSHILAIWFQGCFAGWIVLLFGHSARLHKIIEDKNRIN